MKDPITKEEWTARIAPYHFPNEFAEPIKRIWGAWEDAGTDPLGTLLEWIKWSEICMLHEVPAAVMMGQMMLESGKGKRQDVPLGIKASAADKAAGKAQRFETLELLVPEDITRVQQAGDFIAFTGRKSKDGTRQEIKCYQWFLKGSVGDNINKYLRYYETHRPDRARFIVGGPEHFLRYVTTATPYAYATGEGYVEGVMGLIRELKLEDLDVMVIPKAN